MDRHKLRILARTTKEYLSLGSLALAARHPLFVLSYALSEADSSTFIKSLAEVSDTDMDRFRKELSAKRLATHISQSLEPFPNVCHGAMNIELCKVLYILVRAKRPRIVVETGVASGASSAFLLQALEDNGVGKLHSVELPPRWAQHSKNDRTSLPEGRESGWMVPGALRWRWSMTLGSSKDRLPDLLDRIGKVDMFLHDSEHTYENMHREYARVWPSLAESGLLLSHDIEKNAAFKDFAAETRKRYLHFLNLGGIRK